MSPSAPSQNGTDAVLAEVVEEFTNRVQAGEAVDVESYVQRHPEYAERLRQLLPALALLGDLGRSLSPSPDGALMESREGTLAGVLGDFRIHREVGRGGMGVVYEAEQISLRRRVALKVLPFAATMDPRHLQRFHNEAQAAASLHHNNIVPVYFVGSERGVHFYAMQFIDGQTLSELIRRLRGLEKKTPTAGEEQTVAYQPSPGDAAPTPLPVVDLTPWTGENRRGRDYFRKVAELGIQAAEALDHAHQLGIVHRDIKPGNLLLEGSGRLWVTDFGLAHMQQSEANLTVTGQAVGTPRYMSPEQALAKRAPIDHRTDVYSLGVTLYELLTLRPAFPSEDRQELLRQIASEEPARPRKLERTIPAELEIIVLKAMAKEPAERYATAQELADDLRRFHEDRPIQARRPSLLQRLRKWARRHQAAVLLGAAVSCAVALVLACSTAWVLWANRQKDDALAAKDDALEKKDQALREARDKGEQARIKGEEARQNLQNAEKNMAVVWGSLDGLRDIGVVLEAAERTQEAYTAYAIVLEILDRIDAGLHTPNFFLNDDDFRQSLRAELLNRIAGTQATLGRLADAEKRYRQAILLWGKLTTIAPHPNIAFMRKWDEALAQIGLGSVLADMDQRKEAVAAYSAALNLLMQLPEKKPSPDPRLAGLARAHGGMGTVLWRIGHREEAGRDFRQAEADWDRARAMVRGGSAEFCDSLATFLAECPDPARCNSARSVELARESVKRDPRQGSYWRTLGVAHYRSGDYVSALTTFDEADKRLGTLGSAGWFYRAMTQWKCRHKDEARMCFQQAEKERGKSPSVRLANLSAETAALLGLKRH